MPIRDFPFLRISDLNYIPNPLLPIKIVNPSSDKFIRSYGLIDTGATVCVIPAKWARSLGHDLEQGTPNQIDGAGGRTTSYSHTTKIEIYNASDLLCHTINNTPIDFMPNLKIVILGVKQFLDQFELHINYPLKKFSIK